MRRGALLVLLLVAAALAGVAFLYYKLDAVDVARHNRIVAAIDDLKRSNASLNEDIYKVYAGVGRNYDGITLSVLSLRDALAELKEGEAALGETNDRALIETLSSLDQAVLRKVRLIDEFKLRHAILKNSLDYFPVIIDKVQETQLSSADRDHVLSLIRAVLFIAINGDQSWLNAARREYNYLEEHFYQHELMPHLLAHAWLIIEGSQKLHLIFVEESQAPLEVEIDSLNYAYALYHERKAKGFDQYRILMLVVVALLAVVIIYMVLLLSRNAYKLFRERERAQVTLSSISDSVIVTNGEGIVEFINPVAERMTGWSAEQSKGVSFSQVVRLLDDATHESSEAKIAAVIGSAEPQVFKQPLLLENRAGGELLVEVVVTPLHDQTKRVVGSLIVLHDVTQAQRMARKLEWQATHDALTGLVNRREFEHRVNEALITAHQDRAVHALMYLDLDQFKVVNDTCGHMAGDELLCQVTEHLKNVLRAGDTLARLGGDEFGVLLTYCPERNAEVVAEKLLQAIRDFAFYWEGKSFRIGVSIGLVPVTEYAESLSSLLSAADVACYAAKDGGRNRVHLYQFSDEEMARRHDEMHWVARLNDALQHDSFVLYGQAIKPILDEEGEGLYREVLIRMKGSDGAIIPPGAFLPAAERYNLIGKVDRWVIEHAFEYYAQVKSEKGVALRLSINLSGSSVGDKELHDFIQEKLRAYEVQPQDITFELTETAAITNMNQAIKMMRELRPLGCRFALDDFGAGLSSLGYLKNLPIDFIKIDGKFVKDIESDAVSRAMVEMITRVGKVMGVRTVAEFVENQQIVGILRQIGVDYAQGYGIDMPHLLTLDEAG